MYTGYFKITDATFMGTVTHILRKYSQVSLRNFVNARVPDLLAAVLNFQIRSRGANEIRKFVPGEDQQMFTRCSQFFSN